SRAGDGTGPQGAITIKGKGEFFDDDETKAWFYPALAAKVTGGEPEAQKAFEDLLDSPLRTILAVTPEKYIMYNATLANRHMRGEVSEDELGKPKSSDAERMNKYRKERGLDERDPEKWEDA
ncbi:MAG: hypothetical protein R3360_01095, partial [Alphaproteobacteria bacterium]|nr:hypothetical protein [Alphaproteobacteria bacterium]